MKTTLVVSLVAITILAIGYILFINYSPSQSSPSNPVDNTTGQKIGNTSRLEFTPLTAIDKANAFVIENVGKEYFLANYELDINKTEKRNEELSIQSREGVKDLDSYSVSYNYKALNQVGGDNREVVIVFDHNGDVSRGLGIFDCMNRPILCTFSVTKEKALNIAQQEGFNVISNKFDIFTIDANDEAPIGAGWAWFISEPAPSKDPRCFGAKELQINLSTGKKIGPSEHTVCGD